MMMTAIECHRQGIVYASVHDSYWTHASDVDQMSATLRDCFIKLHSQDLLGSLRRDFQDRYKGFLVRKSGTTDAARKLTEQLVKMGGVDGAGTMDINGIAGDLGSSALPPMTIASDDLLLQHVVTQSFDPEEDERLEERSFAMEDDTESNMEVEKNHKTKAAKGAKTKTKSKSKKDAEPSSGGVRSFDLGALIPPVPPRGTFDLEVIRNSPYFFS